MMIPSDIIPRRQVIEYMLSGLSNADALTKWEEDFIESLQTQYEVKQNLSEKQCEKLEEIYNRVM